MNKNSRLKVSLIIILSFCILSIPSKYTGSFRLSLMKFIKYPLIFSANFVRFFGRHFDYRKLMLENSKLRKETIELRLKNIELKNLKQENKNLRSLLKLKRRFPYKSIASRVIGLDYSDNRKLIFLESGSENSVRENMVCLNAQGLIGKVIASGRGISKAICLTDPNSRVPAKLEHTQEQGLVYGTVKGRFLEMRYLRKESKAEPGERVVTSGLGNIYPPGILIGKILEIRQESFYNIALLLPSVNFFSLDEVLLIERELR